MHINLTSAAKIEKAKLEQFLSRFYPQIKCDFLSQHGAWRHQGDENRWVLTVDGQIAGYCAIIPTSVQIHKKIIPALWWVDIIIAPEFRGQGLQTHFDEKIKQYDRVKLGFPNELAAKIHRKHGWGVREDLQVRLAPLKPFSVGQVRHAQGWHGLLLKLGAAMLSPIAAIVTTWLKRYHPESVRKVPAPSPELLASIYSRYPPNDFATTYRDPAFFSQRFLSSPHRDQMTYYLAGPLEAPSHYLITRTFSQDKVEVTRILDLYGDFSDHKQIRKLLFCVLGNATRFGVSQVTIMASMPELTFTLRRAGFLFSAPARFCWLSADAQIMQELGEKNYWTLADSDNDEIR